MWEAATEVEQLGLPPEALVQLRDTRRDQTGRELEGLGRGTQPADVKMESAETKPLGLERLGNGVDDRLPVHPPLVVARVGRDLRQLGVERRRIRVGEGQDAQADICRSTELLCEAGDCVELARVVDVDRHARLDGGAQLGRLLVAPVQDEQLGGHPGSQGHGQLAEPEAVTSHALFDEHAPDRQVGVRLRREQERHPRPAGLERLPEPADVCPDLRFGGHVQGRAVLRCQLGRGAAFDPERAVLVDPDRPVRADDVEGAAAGHIRSGLRRGDQGADDLGHRLLEDVEQLVELLRRRRQRRRQDGHPVARPQEQTLAPRSLSHPDADVLSRGELLLRLGIAHELEAEQETLAARVADSGDARLERLQASQPLFAASGGVRHQIALSQLLQRREPRCAGDGVAGVGVTGRELQPRRSPESLREPVRDHRCRERDVAAGQPLPEHEDVGPGREELGCEQMPGAAEPGDDLVEDEDDVVPVAQLP